MSGIYDKHLRQMAFDICKTMGFAQFVQEGVYCMVGGPNFESIAEAGLLHKLGVDAVGKDPSVCSSHKSMSDDQIKVFLIHCGQI